jgi:hypothetical protein
VNRLDGGSRPAWPLLLAVFVTGLAVALLLPIGRGAGPSPSQSDAGAVEPVRAPGADDQARDARTRSGAVAAAAAFVCNGQTLLDLDPLAAEQTLREASASASADAIVDRHLEQLDAVREVLAAGTGPIVFRQSSIAWRVEAFSEDRARVAIWSVGVLSRDGVAPPQSSWSTSVVDLVWESGGWRVWGETITAGPTPIADDSDVPATSTQLTAALEGFEDFGAQR